MENEETNNSLGLSEEDITRVNNNLDEVLEANKELEDWTYNIIEQTQTLGIEEAKINNETTETPEAEDKIIEVEKINDKPYNSNTEWTDTSSMKWLDILAKLSVPYNDPSVIFTNSPELELVDYYFRSITCR